jgi:hypothetical protein
MNFNREPLSVKDGVRVYKKVVTRSARATAWHTRKKFL